MGGFCICGEPWYPSDGGPCHESCEECGSIIRSNDPPICDTVGRCIDCVGTYLVQHPEIVQSVVDDMMRNIGDDIVSGENGTTYCLKEELTKIHLMLEEM